jgi:hypothetical protein
MKTITVGLRINGETGFQFFGFDQVNEAIRCGGRVVSVDPGDVVLNEAGSEDGNAIVKFTGYTMVIVTDEQDGKTI